MRFQSKSPLNQVQPNFIDSSPSKIQKHLINIIESGLLLLVALMPLHAFLSVWFGKLSGHQSFIQSWKEILLVLLGLLMAWLLYLDPLRIHRLKQPLFYALAGFIVVGLVVSAITRPPVNSILFGVKIDCEFIIAFILSSLIGSTTLLKRMITLTLISSVLVIGFGFLQIFVLPQDFLTHFGYGPSTIEPFQRIDSTTRNLRFSSFLGGPNQLGSYLIIILSLMFAKFWNQRMWFYAAGLIAGTTVLIHTFSRAAWIGGIMSILIISYFSLSKKIRKKSLIAGGIFLAVLLLSSPMLINSSLVQHYFFHGSALYSHQKGSDFEHLASLRSGSHAIITEPLGHGFGTAGPSVLHTGNGQVYEDYYLQIGYETGILGVILFIAGGIFLFRNLKQKATEVSETLPLIAALCGLSISALFLPIWTDSSTALIYSTLAGAGVAIPLTRKEINNVASK